MAHLKIIKYINLKAICLKILLIYSNLFCFANVLQTDCKIKKVCLVVSDFVERSSWHVFLHFVHGHQSIWFSPKQSPEYSDVSFSQTLFGHYFGDSAFEFDATAFPVYHHFECWEETLYFLVAYLTSYVYGFEAVVFFELLYVEYSKSIY